MAILLLIFIVLSLICFLLSRRLRKHSGLPEGEIVYSDTTARPGELLLSQRYGMSGKPDYLLDDRNVGLIPVEVKSGVAPRNSQPYLSHLMQLAVYFLLVEEVLNSPAPYGLIRYRDRTLRIENTEELREDLLTLIKQMRKTLVSGEAHRSHNQVRRCASCSLADGCDERLP